MRAERGGGDERAPPAAEPVRIRACDGRELAGLLVAAATPRAALVVNGATGFPREFYLKFAHHCAGRGYHALVYDYRGMGASRRAPLPEEPARMSDWGALDMPAALAWLRERFAALPAATVGHSVGGQLIGLMPNHAAARAHVLVAASTGYWRWQHAPFRYMALAFWHLYGPLMLRRHGYVPQGRLWAGQSLPPAVFSQWRRWCLSPAHFGPDLGTALREHWFDDVRAPMLLCASEDDPIATRRSVAALLPFYPNARIEQRWVRPAALGARSIGHHGYFAERHREALWDPLLDWLDRHVHAGRPRPEAQPLRRPE